MQPPCLLTVSLLLVVALLGDSLVNSVPARIFAIGGSDDKDAVRSDTDVFDFDLKTWSQAFTDLPVAATKLGAAAINGFIYAVGGNNGSIYDSVSAATLEYNPRTNAWRQLASMSTKRMEHGVATLGGRVYAVGGHNGDVWLQSAESYDPKANVWTPIANMSVPRSLLAVAVLDDVLYAIGGTNKDTDYLNLVEKYDPKTNTWSAIAPLNTMRRYHCAASVGQKLYAIGGSDGAAPWLASVEVHDPKTGKWSFVASLSRPKVYAGAVAFNGLIHVVGGGSSWSDVPAPVDQIEVYDPTTDLWSLQEAKMPSQRKSHAVVLLENASYPDVTPTPLPWSTSTPLPSSTSTPLPSPTSTPLPSPTSTSTVPTTTKGTDAARAAFWLTLFSLVQLLFVV